MKNRIMAFTIVATSFSPMAAGTGILPTQLRCQYVANPLCIDEERPRLSWVLFSEERAQAQTAYQVLVASSEEKLAAGEGDLWDSGRVESDQCIQVAYDGRPLQSLMCAFWRVRVWDRNAKPSDWSETATWQMGLLKPGDWKAKWIGSGIPRPAMLRKTFRLASRPYRATAYVSALGVYELWLNGRRVGDSVLAPEWTDYNKRVQYQAYDVTELLHSGENALGSTLCEGWYAGRIGISHIVWPGGPQRGFYGDSPWFLMQLEVELADGKSQMIVSDEAWKATTDGPIRSACILDGEVYDARKEVPGWDRPEFDDSGWKAVRIKSQVTAKLVAQANEPIRIVEELRPISVTETKPNVFVFDLGQNMTGWCRLSVRGLPGTTISLRHAEVLDADRNIYTDNLRVPKDGGPGGARQLDTFILGRVGEEILEPHFTYHGFRYVEVTGLLQKPQFDSLVGCVIHSDAPRVGRFECSDWLLNKLMENIVWTQHGNMHSVPTDCPQRDERLGWLGDAQIFSQTACFNMNMARFYGKVSQDTRDAQADDGRFPDFAPHPFDPNARFSGAPGWADGGVIIPWRVYLNYGDTRVLEQHFESAKRWGEYVRAQSPDLIWTGKRGNDYGDWLNGDTLILEGWPRKGAAVPRELMATAFFAHSAGLLSKMASVLSRTEDAERYAKLAAEIKDAFNRTFVKLDGVIQGDTQAGYALALHFDLLPENLREAAARHMVECIKARGGHLTTGIQSTGRLMLELTRNGYNDLAYELLNKRTVPSWLYMVEHGATTIWERWDGYVEGRGYQDPGMNSFNHWAFGAVGEWIYRTIVGINPDEDRPGYKHFTIRPRPGGGLTWANGSYESMHGTIVSDWKVERGDFTLRVTVPVNTTAAVYIPARRREDVTEGGRPAGEAQGVRFLRSEDGAALYEVASGIYTFVSRGAFKP
ncbi:MAG: glycoside hydrolase family 78 protein [bacterium]|nr:glycoside hydrolase family 78 protein [bacterium]